MKTTIILTIIITIYSSILPIEGYFQKNVFKNSIRRDLKEECPKVKGMRNFELNEIMGPWYVLQYYASSEEAAEYACMKCVFSINDEDKHITLNVTYIYKDDPLKDEIQGNITSEIPNFETPEHWVHSENSYGEIIYNTYILDTDYTSWALIMHCAEKYKSPRYLSALLLSRKSKLGVNEINFLREKLPRYDIDLSFMFPVNHDDCNVKNLDKPEILD